MDMECFLMFQDADVQEAGETARNYQVQTWTAVRARTTRGCRMVEAFGRLR
jgi:hypothetical protein